MWSSSWAPRWPKTYKTAIISVISQHWPAQISTDWSAQSARLSLSVFWRATLTEYNVYCHWRLLIPASFTKAFWGVASHPSKMKQNMFKDLKYWGKLTVYSWQPWTDPAPVSFLKTFPTGNGTRRPLRPRRRFQRSPPWVFERSLSPTCWFAANFPCGRWKSCWAEVWKKVRFLFVTITSTYSTSISSTLSSPISNIADHPSNFVPSTFAPTPFKSTSLPFPW